LEWYDRHARIMPWRVSPQDRASGVRPDPYFIWMSEVMLQQTTVAAVRAYFRRFTERWPTVRDLAQAQDADVMAEWAGLGYYARARNLLACARVVANTYQGVFPQDSKTLLTLPGIGPYTAAAISSIAHDQPETVVDGNVERVISRLFAVEVPLPTAKALLTELASTLTPTKRPGDYAQAIMDLGATICTPRNPACGICPWASACKARNAGIAAKLPRKIKKPTKPTREGCVWVLFRHDDAVLIEDRPSKGLLGGMLGLPGDAWDGRAGSAPAAATWRACGEVRHTFTHFHLNLAVFTSRHTPETTVSHGRFVLDIKPTDLPTLMRKAFELAKSADIAGKGVFL
jgi:A/G-specific adenine glycosylase